MSTKVTIVGGGLAGSEAAWQLAEQGFQVELYEMRPKLNTGAHSSEDLAELVCSNSLGSDLPDRCGGLLKREMERMDSELMRCARATAVPAGGCLAVDREAFPRKVTEVLEAHPNITIIREEVTSIPEGPTIIASGPLTSPTFSEAIAELGGKEHLFFYDAISPIVEVNSVNMDIAYRASRHECGEQVEGDYINCPLNRSEYENFVEALATAERIELESFERDIGVGVKTGLHKVFEGCLPIEILAGRGKDTLAYGPMRPVGLDDPRTGRWPHAVLQLRQDNIAGSLFNLVGFQTNLKFAEQKRVFAMIPGLETAEFVRYGQMHRNTFIHAPELLHSTLQCTRRDDLFFAGQITGVEGYAGNIATGLLAGRNMALKLQGKAMWTLPETTMIGALCHYVTHADPKDFQPMKANYGILPGLTPPEGKRKWKKRDRAAVYAARAMNDLETYLQTVEEVTV